MKPFIFNRIVKKALLAGAAIFFCPFSFAIGDSAGGCKVLLKEAAIKAAAWGTPQDLEAAIGARVASLQQSLLHNRKGLLSRIFSRSEQQKSSKFEEEIRQGVVNEEYHCYAPLGTKLLDYAASLGNIANVEYLLDHGADPNAVYRAGGSTIFMRCIDMPSISGETMIVLDSARTRTPDQASAMLAAYALILKRGGNLNLADQSGATPLHLCNDPVAIEFYLKNGADPSRKQYERSTALDVRVEGVVRLSPREKDSALAIARLLASSSNNREMWVGTQRTVCGRCSYELDLEPYCLALGEILSVQEKRIFTYKKERKKGDNIWRCSAFVERDCKTCDWSKHYSLESDEPILQSASPK